MEVKLPNKNKKNVIILSILAFVFLASGSFLLWRVNQEKTVAPTGGGASEQNCVDRCTGPCTQNWPYKAPDQCTDDAYKGCELLYQGNILHGCCLYERVCNVTAYYITYVAGANGSVTNAGQNNVAPGGSISSTATPNAGYKFVKWSDGKTTATRTDSNVQADATYTATFEALPPANTCDAKNAKWVTKPAASIPYGSSIPFEYITGDTDGVQNANIIVKLDGASVPVTKVPATGDAPNITVKGTLNSNGTLTPGSHKLEISWNDIKGAGGPPCYAYAIFTVGPAPVNTCDAKGARWVTKPAATVPYGILIPFEYVTGDTDGVQNANIIVKLDGASVRVTKVPATGDAPNITVKGSLHSNRTLVPGSHKLEISWNDVKGAGGPPCYAYATFTVGPAPVNTCDAKGARWVTKPAASIPYGSSIPFEYVTGDTDGVQNANVIVKLDGTSVPVTKIPATGNVPNLIVKGTLNLNGTLAPGSHKLEISWNDIKGAGGPPCYAYAIFTVGPAPVNTCDAKDAGWVIKPATRIEFGKPIPFEYVTGDTDGVQNASIIVKLDGASVPVTKVPATGDAPNITVKGTLNSSGTLAPGSHKLEISWNDVKGAGGVPCYVYSMMTILPENPEWDIEKQVVETCVNDGTTNPVSNLSYTITITNTNTDSGSGKIDVIEDALDPKVVSTKVTDISNGGVVGNGKITWNLTSPLSDFDPGESKSFTYSISVDKEFFGIYENTVIATPGAAEGYSPTNLEASASIEAKCNILEEPEPPSEEPEPPLEEPLPDTGIFDDGQNSLILGFVLLILGFTWRLIGSNTLLLINNAIDLKKKVSKERELKISRKRKKNLERKVVKD